MGAKQRREELSQHFRNEELLFMVESYNGRSIYLSLFAFVNSCLEDSRRQPCSLFFFFFLFRVFLGLDVSYITTIPSRDD